MNHQQKLPFMLIGGDLCPVGKLASLLLSTSDFFDMQLNSELAAASLVAVNLEAPVTHAGQKTPKSGPSLRADPRVMQRVRDLGIDTVFLANNHIMDFGVQGLENTLHICEQVGIRTLGAGSNLDRAREPLIHVIDGVRIAIINVAEVEFGAARSDHPGYHGLDVIDCVRLIKKAKATNDVVVVSLHGGLEYFALPRPGLREICRFFIEQGVAAVVCHHTHVSSAYELHEGRPIFYGVGNFIFDNDCGRLDWEIGYLVKFFVDTRTKSISGFEMLPYQQSNAVGGVRLLSGDMLRNFHRELAELNETLRDSKRYLAAWAACCAKKEREYLALMYFPFLHWPISILIHLPFFRQIVFPLSRVLIRLNLIRCDSHYEVLRFLHATAAEQRKL